MAATEEKTEEGCCGGAPRPAAVGVIEEVALASSKGATSPGKCPGSPGYKSATGGRILIMTRAQRSHPLDPLSVAEISVAVATVRAAGRTPDDS
ncbi:hypothetical protein E2562_002429 [Oryza meyeriana var. granulata]|uniref:Uncharacterized protein n=1 Tax=Oryza meyeriana var. granulata TaxID=110450 RepID=A0A6G1F2D2_9ORYZ|nr:hypothetical protein E2562_002429 [Oryza meyeriana var. granulata]